VFTPKRHEDPPCSPLELARVLLDRLERHIFLDADESRNVEEEVEHFMKALRPRPDGFAND
jgi:hypothetical protein